MSDLHPDAVARRAALDPRRSFCVTAPAGSGKTELLTQRILALLPTVERPEQVLAITFTRKAAAEMRERLLQKLEEARAQIPVKAEHEQITRDLANKVLAHAAQQQWSLDPELFNLRTIDSLCGELTRQMPVLSAIGGSVETTDQDRPLFEQAVNDLLKNVESRAGVGEDLRALLLHFNNDWTRVRTLLVDLLGRRGDWGGSLGQHRDPDDASLALQQTVDSLVVGVLGRVTAVLEPHLQELGALASFAAAQQGEAGVSLDVASGRLGDWQRAAKLLLTDNQTWRKPGGITIKQGFPAKTEEKERIQALLTELSEGPVPDPLLELRALPIITDDNTSWQLVLHLSRLLPVLLAHLLLVFQREGKVDFAHIALAAADALGTDDNPTELALRLDYQLAHILVDEFQDTSDQQFELLRRLTRGWAEHNAAGYSPRTLFIVGDGMQSIYGFRYANVGLFLTARDTGIGGLMLEPLALTRNFRSQQGVVDWVNEVFARLLPPTDDPARGQVRHTRADATHQPLPGEAVAVHIFPDDQGVQEAEWIADQVVRIKAESPQASVAVLVRARRHVLPVIAALRERDVAFIGRDLENLSHTPAVMDLMSLCRWLTNPADDVASLALMRAPFCGLSLADIHRITANQPRPIGLRQALRRALRNEEGSNGLSEDASIRAQSLLKALDWAEARRDRLSLPVWVEQIWLRLQAPRALLPGEETDVLRFFDLLRQAEGEGVGLNLDWLEGRLEKLFAEHPPSDGAVELMTLHKSKGLQFDYIFMPMLHKSSRSGAKDLLRWHLHIDGDRHGLLIAANDQQPKTPTLYNYLNWLQAMKDEAELRRLLYVGVTRAKQRVFLTGQAKEDSESDGGLAWPAAKTPLGILRESVAHTTHLHPLRDNPSSNELGPGVEFSGRDGSTGDMGTDRRLLGRLPSTYLSSPRTASVGESGLDAEGGAVVTAHAADTRESNALNFQHNDCTVAAAGNRLERAIGVVVHRGLELLSQRNPLPEGLDAQLSAAVEMGLRGENLAGRRLQEAQRTVEEMLVKTLSDARGRWILTQHSGAHSELALYSASNLRGDEEGDGDGLAPGKRIIDRTFIDPETGERWIVDYKTSRPMPEETLTDFGQRERQHYASQLSGYATLLQGFDQPEVTIRMALYFPAIPYWLPIDP